MDRLSIVVSLLLILSVTTTFGSVIKAKNPTKEEPEGLRSDPDSSRYHEMPRNSKELEALLKRSHGSKRLRDQDSEMPKFEDVPEAEVIPGYELTPARMEKFLGSLPSASRVVAIGIDNESGSEWTKFPTYFSSGTEDKTLPYNLPDESAVLYGALSTEVLEPAAIGVLGYYIPSIGKTLSVMWSNPLYAGNTWNIRLYNGQQPPDSDMYIDLRDHDAMGPGKEDKTLGSGLKFTGELSSDGAQVTLEIHVKPDKMAFR